MITSNAINLINVFSSGFNTLSIGSWFIGQIRGFFLMLDNFIYYFITILYNLIYDLANLSFFTSGDLGFITKRIYTLLAIFMLFRVTFSLITYVIAPDQFSDKNAGLQNLIRNIVISFILIIMSPWIFTKMYDVQNAILNDNVIPQFILGEGSSELGNSVVISERCCKGEKSSDGTCANNDFYRIKPASTGDYIAFVAFKPFFQLDDSTLDSEILYSSYCYVGGSETATISRYIGMNDIAEENTAKKFMINYSMVFSTATGVFLAAILISFCFDIAIRSFNLAFLQIFAPIPIISFVDPKSAKSGMFNKYVKTTIKVWAGVFIRIVAFSFAIFFIQLIGNSISNGFVLSDGSKPRSPTIWVGLFAILGALMFAKKFPKFLEEVTGIKMDGAFKLNPLNRIKDEALGGKMVAKIPGTAAALGIGAAGGFIAGGAVKSEHLANAIKNKDLKAGLKGAGGMLAGGVSGFFRGGTGGLTGGYKSKSISDSLKAGAGSVKKAGQDITKIDGTRWGDRTSSSMASRFGLKTVAQKMDDEVKINEEIGKMKDSIMNAADVDNHDMGVSERFYNSQTGLWTTIRSNGKGTKALKKQLEDVEKSGASVDTIAAYRNLYEQSQAAYVNANIKNDQSQVGMLANQLRDLYQKNQEYSSISSLSGRMDSDGYIQDLASLKGMFGDTKNSITALQSGTAKVNGQTWQQAHAADNAVKTTK